MPKTSSTKLFSYIFLFISAVVIGLLNSLNDNYGLIMLGIVLGGFFLIFSIYFAPAIIFLAILSGGFVGSLSGGDMMGLPISLSGIVTFYILICVFIVLLTRKFSRITIESIKSYSFFILFIGYYFVRTITGPTVIDGLKMTSLITTPIFVGILAYQEMMKRERVREYIEKAIMIIPILPISVIVINIIFGTLEMNSLKFNTTIVLSFSSRTLSLFLLPILALYISRWRYSSRIIKKTLLGLVSLSITGTIISGLSRMASVISLVFIWPSRLFKKIFSFTTIALVILGLGLIVIWFSLPEVQSRFFPGGIDLTNLNQGLIKKIDTQGRSNLWRLTWESALKNPIIGNGGGYSTVLVKETYPNLEHPHNDYLRVLNDTGIIGLIIFGMAWLVKLFHYFKEWQRSNTQSLNSAPYFMAAFLSVGAVILSLITDNTMSYTFITINAFCLFSLAETSKQKIDNNNVK